MLLIKTESSILSACWCATSRHKKCRSSCKNIFIESCKRPVICCCMWWKLQHACVPVHGSTGAGQAKRGIDTWDYYFAWNRREETRQMAQEEIASMMHDTNIMHNIVGKATLSPFPTRITNSAYLHPLHMRRMRSSRQPSSCATLVPHVHRSLVSTHG